MSDMSPILDTRLNLPGNGNLIGLSQVNRLDKQSIFLLDLHILKPDTIDVLHDYFILIDNTLCSNDPGPNDTIKDSTKMNTRLEVYPISFISRFVRLFLSAYSGIKLMMKPAIGFILVLFWIMPAWASLTQAQLTDQKTSPVEYSPITLFQQYIPSIAEQYIGMPFKLGGHPKRTGSTDNASLFYAIYTTAAQKAGMTYKAYLPMRYLIKNTNPVDLSDVKNGDLIVLNNDLAAMVFRTEPMGRLHFIYASVKRQQVISFHSENLVYHAYWLEHLKGFYRLKDEMLQPGK